jgi:ferritin
MSEAVSRAINDQIVHEFQSAHQYLSLAAWFEDRKLPGFASWMRVQAREEQGHAMRFFEHMVDRDWRVRLGPIEEPRQDFDSPLEAATTVLENERRITRLINNLSDLAVEAHDYAARVLLDWFVNEQVEEEKIADQLVADVKLAGNDPSALLYLDGRLGQRDSS